MSIANRNDFPSDKTPNNKAATIEAGKIDRRLVVHVDQHRWSDHWGCWWDNPKGDTTIEYGKQQWKVDGFILRRQSGWFRGALSDSNNDDNHHVVIPSHFCKNASPQLFHAILRFIYTSSRKFVQKFFEDVLSFLSCVEIFFIEDFFDINSLKEVMLANIKRHTKLILSVFGANRRPLHEKVPSEEKDHLVSFLNGVIAAETQHGWSARLQRELYDAGDMLRARLLELPDFRHFVATKVGKDFARAIGIRDL
ncbi:hypothetical protein B0T22DRAFT_506725 [Podospora appendiculata]|uniref:BTB domain-containing protein n=1 Tax=Podospora appendiculata TaxID=314037 RepID=A0AAE1CHI6_9PEZI|nr:hypothetical protein B0T22DRAFT_506725 [Podospora appendiculata]